MGELALRHTYSKILSDRRALGLTFAALCLALPSRAVAQRRNCDQARAVLLNDTSTRRSRTWKWRRWSTAETRRRGPSSRCCASSPLAPPEIPLLDRALGRFSTRDSWIAS